jgi:hypothetical protein
MKSHKIKFMPTSESPALILLFSKIEAGSLLFNFTFLTDLFLKLKTNYLIIQTNLLTSNNLK